MSNQNEVIKYEIALSDILNIDEKHQDAYLCSTKYIWNEKCLKDGAKTGLPRNFRVIQNNINQFSASGIFTKLQLKNAIRHIEEINPEIKRIHVIDLMKEYHGFIEYNQNAIPFSWRANYNTVNFGINYQDIAKNELEVIQKMRDKFNGKNLYIVSSFSSIDGILDKIHQHVKINKCKNILTEGDLCASEDIIYHRFSSIDYNPPQYQAIIDLARFTQNEFNPQTDWVHIHCHAGQGRSTSFSILFDMFMRVENSTLNSISFPDLLQFHFESGGKNLLEKPINEWKYPMAIARNNMLHQMYNFLIEINNAGLQDVYSVALKIYFLHQTKMIHNTTFSNIIRDSGPIIEDKIYSDRTLEEKLHNFYLLPDIFDLNSDSHTYSYNDY
jgi:hypothetical protein